MTVTMAACCEDPKQAFDIDIACSTKSWRSGFDEVDRKYNLKVPTATVGKKK